MSTIIVHVEGVLRTDVGVPLADGEQLVRTLIETNRVVLVTGDTNEQKVRQFLALGGIKGYADIYYGVDLLEALRRERLLGHVYLVFLADTPTAQKVFDQGITVCLLAASTFINPEWKPTRKTWGEIVDNSYLSGVGDPEQQDSPAE